MTQAFRAALQHPRWWVVMGLLWVAIIVAGCFAPSQPDVGVLGFDKVLHISAFAGLAFWFGAVYEKRRHLLIAALLITLGLAIEIAQGQTGYRSGDMFDLIADTIGVALGIGLARTRLANALRYIEARVIPARN